MADERERDPSPADKVDEPEHHDPLLRHLTDWTRQVGEQPRERVAMGIAAAARGFHAQLKALPTSTRFTQSAGTSTIDAGTEKLLRDLLDRAYKMMLMSGYRLQEHDSDHNDPITAWMSDVRVVLYGNTKPEPDLARLR